MKTLQVWGFTSSSSSSYCAMAPLAPAIETLLTECVSPFQALPAASSTFSPPTRDPELCISIQNLN